ncbi:zinc ribbon domain-containing protein [Cohnella terricola]|uniref:PEGA domain-containing protein n=1 Tax=Cohnella terricola TaxID=1289167 RepID=A0A559JN41_9BACL|nr:hypothetical protein [Cohnella terricola]TVY01286.1 hypothetical protein FPZ45_09055 [Cohnella terricola]
MTEIYYCKECGTRMEGGYDFCPECGSTVAESQVSPTQGDNVQRRREPPQKNASAMSIKAKIAVAGALVIVLLAAGAYFLGKYLSDEQRLLNRFEQTIEDGKPDKLLEMLAASNGNMPVDRHTAEGIANYLKTDKEAMLALLIRLRGEAEQLRTDGSQSFENDKDAAFVYLHKKETKRWFIFDDYELKLKRYMVPVSANYEDTRIFVDGREAGTIRAQGDMIELGPFLPGEYSFKAVYEGEYTTLEKEFPIKLFPIGNDADRVELALEGDYVDVYADNSYAHIFINGKDIELAVGDGQHIGPIALDGSNKMQVEVEYPWGTAKSEELPIDGNVLEFNIPRLSDTVQKDVMDATYDFVNGWMQAFRDRDVRSLRHVHPDRTRDLAEIFADMRANDEFYVGDLHRVTFDLDSFGLNQYAETDYVVSVKVRVEYSEAFYYSAFEETAVPVEGVNDNEYRLQYQNGQWLVTGWSVANDVGMAHTKIYE